MIADESGSTDRLKEHNITLHGERIVLRPMTEDDWDILLAWNSDAEVLYYADGNDVSSYSLEEVQGIYRPVSHTPAFCFIIEFEGRSVGECWLQKMNLAELIEQFPGSDLRRIDIAIGEKELWGKGLGTEAIGLLTKFGFERENVDMVFGCSIGDYNPRSRRAFEKNGYTLYREVPQKEGSKARVNSDVARSRAQYFRNT